MGKKRPNGSQASDFFDVQDVLEMYRESIDELREEIVKLGSVIGFLDRVIREVQTEVQRKGVILGTSVDMEAAMILVDKLCEGQESDENELDR